MKKVKQVYVFLYEKNGEEGLVGEYIQGNVFFPFICPDIETVNYLLPRAKLVAKEHKMKIRVVKFTIRKIVKVIK